MRLSIIIPVYNVEHFVGKTLSTIFQTSARSCDFEVIVINDGTLDKSMDTVRQFEDKPNLVIIEQCNQGLSAARMKGVSFAKGEYVWFVDGDDWVVENSVQTVLDILNNNEDIDLLMFPIRWINEIGEEIWQDYNLEHGITERGANIIQNNDLPLWATPRFIIKRVLFNCRWLYFPIGFLHEDEYFGPVLLSLAKSVYVLKDPIYNYYKRPSSIIQSISIRSSYDIVAIHRLLMRFMLYFYDPSDYIWFRRYCMNLLSKSYSINKRKYGKKEFRSFIKCEKRYIYNQFLRSFPKASIPQRFLAASFLSWPFVCCSFMRLFKTNPKKLLSF